MYHAPSLTMARLPAGRPACAPCPPPVSGEAPTPDAHVTPPRWRDSSRSISVSLTSTFASCPRSMREPLSATGGIIMDAHRHSAMKLHQGKSSEPQRWHMPTGLAADTRPLRGRRRLGWSRGAGLLGLIGLLGLLGWGTAPPQAQDLLQQPSQSPRVLEPSRHVTQPGPYGPALPRCCYIW